MAYWEKAEKNNMIYNKHIIKSSTKTIGLNYEI